MLIQTRIRRNINEEILEISITKAKMQLKILLADFEKLLEELKGPSTDRATPAPVIIPAIAPATFKVDLPKSKVFWEEKFDNYSNFKAAFKIAYGNPPYTHEHRIIQLLNLVKGDAAKYLRHYGITTRDYKAAIKLLDKQYGNKELMGCELIENFKIVKPATFRDGIHSLKEVQIEFLSAAKNMKQIKKTFNTTSIKQILVTKIGQYMSQVTAKIEREDK
jgi:hypothetical protein